MKHLILTIDTGTLDFNNLTKEALPIEYIAKVLANTYRFGGSSKISVLQHSINVVRLAAYGRGYSVELMTEYNYFSSELKAALLHEISEAVGLGDIITPIKAFLGKKARKRINYIEEKLCELYDVIYPFSSVVHRADRLAYVYEVETFLDKTTLNYTNHVKWSNITEGEISYIEEYKRYCEARGIVLYDEKSSINEFITLYNVLS